MFNEDAPTNSVGTGGDVSLPPDSEPGVTAHARPGLEHHIIHSEHHRHGLRPSTGGDHERLVRTGVWPALFAHGPSGTEFSESLVRVSLLYSSPDIASRHQ